MKYLALSLAAATTLGACAADDPAVSSFYREAGAAPAQGTFGSAVNQNMAVNNGSESYRIEPGAPIRGRSAEHGELCLRQSTALDEQARATLRRQADFIRQFPEVRFKVYGHTDLVGARLQPQSRPAPGAGGRELPRRPGDRRSRLEAVVSLRRRPAAGRQRGPRTAQQAHGHRGVRLRRGSPDGARTASMPRSSSASTWRAPSRTSRLAAFRAPNSDRSDRAAGAGRRLRGGPASLARSTTGSIAAASRRHTE